MLTVLTASPVVFVTVTAAAACVNLTGNNCCCLSVWLLVLPQSTCKPECEPVDEGLDGVRPPTYVRLPGNCAKFQCLDPAAINNGTVPQHNCTGLQVTPASLASLLSLSSVEDQLLGAIAPALSFSDLSAPLTDTGGPSGM